MSNDDEVTCDEARAILRRFENSLFRTTTKGDRARFSFPGDPDDDDVRLHRFIWQVEAERARAGAETTPHHLTIGKLLKVIREALGKVVGT